MYYHDYRPSNEIEIMDNYLRDGNDTYFYILTGPTHSYTYMLWLFVIIHIISVYVSVTIM